MQKKKKKQQLNTPNIHTTCNLMQATLNKANNFGSLNGFYSRRLYLSDEDEIRDMEKKMSLRSRDVLRCAMITNGIENDITGILDGSHVAPVCNRQFELYGNKESIADNFILALSDIVNATQITQDMTTDSPADEMMKLSGIVPGKFFRESGLNLNTEEWGLDESVYDMCSSTNVFTNVITGSINWDIIFSGNKESHWFERCYEILRRAAESNGKLNEFEESAAKVAKDVFECMVNECSRAIQNVYLNIAVGGSNIGISTFDDMSTQLNANILNMSFNDRLMHLTLVFTALAQMECDAPSLVENLRSKYTVTQITYAACKYLRDCEMNESMPTFYLYMYTLFLFSDSHTIFHPIMRTGNKTLYSIQTNKCVAVTPDRFGCSLLERQLMKNKENDDGMISIVRCGTFSCADILAQRAGKCIGDNVYIDRSGEDLFAMMGYSPKERHYLSGYMSGLRAGAYPMKHLIANSLDLNAGLKFEYQQDDADDSEQQELLSRMNDTMQRAAEKSEAAVRRSEKEIRNAYHKVLELEKRIKELEEQLADAEMLQKATYSKLQDVLEEQLEKEPNEEVPDIEEVDCLEEALNIGSDYKCVVYGGPQNWVKIQQQRLPNVIFIEGHELPSRDVIKNADLVIINTSCMSHSGYDIVQQCRAKSVTGYLYITKQGINNGTKQIVDYCKEYESNRKKMVVA